MKKFIKEFIIWIIQLFMFYLFPLFGGPTDAMGVVVVIIFATFALSLIMGTISNQKFKLLYPVATSLVFLPTVLLHYNESAFVHALWYLVVSSVGIAIGTLINSAVRKIKRT